MDGHDLDKQKLYIHYFLRNPETYTRCMNIIKPEYFNQELRATVAFIMDYANQYSVLPPRALIKTEVGYDPCDSVLAETTDEEIVTIQNWVLTEFEQFCVHKDVAMKVLEAPERIQKGDIGGLVESLKESLLISLERDLGTQYFLDPKSRLEQIKDKSNMVSTGWKAIDDKLYGGLNRGEVTLFAGNSGMGKSLFLQNISLNWAEAKKDVIYFTFELSENLTAMRLDSMITGIGTKEVIRNIDKVEWKVKFKGGESGNIQLKYMSPGTTSNQLRSYLKEYQIQRGRLPDAIAIDYLDLMHPNNNKINPSDLFVKDKYVSEELRALAAEFGVLCVSASQLNRGAVDETVHDIANIAGGLSKVNTVDNVITIYTSQPMRERGEYRLQFIKTRSSSGVGSQILLKFDPTSLRITDMPEGEGGQPKEKSTQESIREQLNNKKIKPSPDHQEESDLGEEESYDPKTGEILEKPKINILDKLNKIKHNK